MPVKRFLEVKNVVHLLSWTVFPPFPLLGLLHLKMEALKFVAKSGTVHLTTQHSIPEVLDLQKHHPENHAAPSPGYRNTRRFTSFDTQISHGSHP